ncbi:hypothetical protein DAPPUDRAFT_238238 [Daphnia pulex]|uniref:Uncharacterized protein n=1 Tax=Daphnia pulex TaxID=6669 RepID=E9G5W2_DAPPU|nr:hypothetical protein DAPPUDRAFT_238238 [Daphnia pulex]|eukprot:EFX84834.1 hypothetical protein DAPPUDRAFT_238238 [Daphnia pulex]
MNGSGLSWYQIVRLNKLLNTTDKIKMRKQWATNTQRVERGELEGEEQADDPLATVTVRMMKSPPPLTRMQRELFLKDGGGITPAVVANCTEKTTPAPKRPNKTERPPRAGRFERDTHITPPLRDNYAARSIVVMTPARLRPSSVDTKEIYISEINKIAESQGQRDDGSQYISGDDDIRIIPYIRTLLLSHSRGGVTFDWLSLHICEAFEVCVS